MKKLSVYGVFGAPDCMNLTNEQIDRVMSLSLKRFLSVSSQIPDLPNEFAIVLVALNDQNIPGAAVRVAWLTAEKEFLSCLQVLIKWLDFMTLKLLGFFQRVNSKKKLQLRVGKNHVQQLSSKIVLYLVDN